MGSDNTDGIVDDRATKVPVMASVDTDDTVDDSAI